MRSMLYPRWMSRLRVLLARHLWVYWLFVVGVAALVSVMVSNAFAEVRRARDSWGETATVQVAIAEIGPGDPVAVAVEMRVVPVAMRPDSAVGHVEADATARQRIAVGEIVVDVDIGPRPGPLALLPAGWLAITVDGATGLSVTVGDHAVVLAAGTTVATDAVVIDVLADSVVIGVPEVDAAAVAEMVAQRLAVIALSGD